MTTTHTPVSRIDSIRRSLRARRAARTEHLALERELASYSTPADLAEFDAILARHSDRDTADVRRILSRHRTI